MLVVVQVRILPLRASCLCYLRIRPSSRIIAATPRKRLIFTTTPEFKNNNASSQFDGFNKKRLVQITPPSTSEKTCPYLGTYRYTSPCLLGFSADLPIVICP